MTTCTPHVKSMFNKNIESPIEYIKIVFIKQS
jgi:hypothetical protein